MIDKLDLQVPESAFLRPKVLEFVREETRQPSGSRELYAAQVDLRPFGLSCMVHLYNRFVRGHKVELIEIGKMGYQEMTGTLEQVFDTDPLKLRVLRADGCADIPQVPVYWFHHNLSVKGKRFSSALAVDYTVMGKRGIETIYFGKRPNCLRVYNKIAKWQDDYARLARRKRVPCPDCEPKLDGATLEAADFSSTGAAAEWARRHCERKRVHGDQAALGVLYAPLDSRRASQRPRIQREGCSTCGGTGLVWKTPELPNFRELFGYERTDTLTRIERQMNGDRVPREIATMRLVRDAAEYDPFSDLRIPGKCWIPVRPEDVGPVEYAAGMMLRQQREEMGAQKFNQYLNRCSRNNAARIIAKYEKFLSPSGEEAARITREEIVERYRDSTAKQMIA
jgi:hypothetical protein